MFLVNYTKTVIIKNCLSYPVNIVSGFSAIEYNDFYIPRGKIVINTIKLNPQSQEDLGNIYTEEGNKILIGFSDAKFFKVKIPKPDKPNYPIEDLMDKPEIIIVIMEGANRIIISDQDGKTTDFILKEHL